MWSTIFNAIGDASLTMFKLLPPIGMAVDIFFVLLIAFGITYWLIYERGVINGKPNFMEQLPKED